MPQHTHKSVSLIFTPQITRFPGWPILTITPEYRLIQYRLYPKYPIPVPQSRIRSSKNPAIFYSKLFGARSRDDSILVRIARPLP